MTPDLHALLTDVAEGRLSPREALGLLGTTPPGDGLGGAPADGPSGPAAVGGAEVGGPAGDQPGADERFARLAFRVTGRALRVVADPTVSTVSVDGPHALRRTGDVLEVVSVPGADDDDATYRFTREMPWWRQLMAHASTFGARVTARVNPALPVGVEMSAGALEVVGLRAPLTYSVDAGSVRVVDHAGTVDGTVRAGSARLELLLADGGSRLRAESGSLDVALRRGSDVRVRAEAELGSAVVADHSGRAVAAGTGASELVLGAGTGSLDVTAVMGSARVRVA